MKMTKKAKKIAALCVCVMATFVLASCGNAYSGIKFEDYIEIGKYKDVELKKEAVTVTDDELTAEINRRLEAKKTSKNVKSGVVKEGDSINIDYVGSIDGKKFSGGEEKGRDLVIGSNTFIPGFESSLIGAQVGTTQNIKVKFPDTYQEKSLAGKNAVFAVTINSKKEYTVPELNEAFVKKNSKVKTVEEYKAEVKKELLKAKETAVEEKYKQIAWANVLQASKMKKDKNDNDKYPDKQLKDFVENTLKSYKEKAKLQNITLGEFVQKNFSMTEKKFNEEINAYAKTQVKIDLVMYGIADKEGLKVTSKEYDEFIENTLKKYGYTQDSFKKANNGKSYETIVGKDKIKAAVLKQKVQEFIVSKAKLV